MVGQYLSPCMCPLNHFLITLFWHLVYIYIYIPPKNQQQILVVLFGLSISSSLYTYIMYPHVHTHTYTPTRSHTHTHTHTCTHSNITSPNTHTRTLYPLSPSHPQKEPLNLSDAVRTLPTLADTPLSRTLKAKSSSPVSIGNVRTRTPVVGARGVAASRVCTLPMTGPTSKWIMNHPPEDLTRSILIQRTLSCLLSRQKCLPSKRLTHLKEVWNRTVIPKRLIFPLELP